MKQLYFLPFLVGGGLAEIRLLCITTAMGLKNCENDVSYMGFGVTKSFVGGGWVAEIRHGSITVALG